MHTMLRDTFGMHEVREENCGPKGVEQLGEKSVNVSPAVGGRAGKTGHPTRPVKTRDPFSLNLDTTRLC
jgi:hypothetical protein